MNGYIDFQKNRFKEIRFFGKIGFLTRPKFLSENGGDKFICNVKVLRKNLTGFKNLSGLYRLSEKSKKSDFLEKSDF